MNWVDETLAGLALLPWATQVFLRGRAFLHVLQLDGYKTHRFLGWLAANRTRIGDRKELGLEGLSLLAGLLALPLGGGWAPRAALALWGLLGIWLVATRPNAPAKKPLVFTARATRLMALGLMVAAGSVLGCSWLVTRVAGTAWPSSAFLGWLLPMSLVSQGAAGWMVAANVLIAPLEMGINQGYRASARRRLQAVRPRVIAITGSYGKTSTKHFVTALLAGKFRVLMTPESYNTPMGICKVIRGLLGPQHEVFVVEMGAYQRGDIRDLCRLTRPEVGILTAIGPQHLERFGTLENITRAKYEVIEALPPGGLAVVNGDDPICARLAREAQKTMPVKVVRYGTGAGEGELDLWAENLGADPSGLSFVVATKGGERGECRTSLLGRHNVLNILAGTAVALEFGLTLPEVAAAVRGLRPPAHRLQLIRNPNGVLVIDDAYNANPVGAQEALEVLRLFPRGTRILVTPGMVELGEQGFEENRRLGVKAAGVCDQVILVGRERTRPIQAGLAEAGFSSERVAVVRNLAEATDRLKTLVKPGDLVLFENDLPDHFAEDS